MAEKRINGRIVLKHDVESNWKLATGFTPMAGEIIIYDIDENYNYERLKIGDGVQNVSALPFVDDTLKTLINDKQDASFKITLTMGSTGISADKTFSEIQNAYANGRNIVADFLGSSISLYGIADHYVAFVISDLNTMTYARIECDPNDNWTFSQSVISAQSDSFGAVKADEKLTTDTIPARIGSDGKLYVDGSLIDNLNQLVGDISVAEQINTSITNKADLIEGKVPVEQLPSTFSGNEMTVVAQDSIQMGSVVYVVGGDSINPYPKVESLSLEEGDWSTKYGRGVAISPNGQLVVLCGEFMGSAKLYSLSGTTLTYIDDIYADNSGTPLDDSAIFARFSPDGTALYLGGYFTGYMKVYSVSGTTITYVSDVYKNLEGEELTDCYTADITRDGTKMVISGAEYDGERSKARLYSVSGTNVTYVSEIYADNEQTLLEDNPYCLSFSPDGNVLVLGGTGYVKIYAVSDDNVTFISDISDDTVPSDRRDDNYGCGFSNDGKLFVIDGYGMDALARVYKVSGTTFTWWKDIAHDRPYEYADPQLYMVRFSPDNKIMALIGALNGCVEFYSVSDADIKHLTTLYANSSGDLLAEVAYDGTFTPDGSKFIVVGDFDGSIKLYSADQEIVSALSDEYVQDYSVAIAQETIEAGESGKIMVVASVKSPDVDEQIQAHNISYDAHSDIRADISDLSTLVGDTSVAEQIEAANIIYVGPDRPTDPNIKVWINTAEEGTGVVPVLPRIATITLAAASWTGNSAPYSQTVSINTVTSATKIDLQPTVEQIVSLQNDDIALMAENTNGTVKIYAFGGKPSADMTMQVLLQEVAFV